HLGIALLLAAPLVCGGAVDSLRSMRPPPPPRFALPAGHVLFSDDFTHGLDAWRADRPGAWTAVHGMVKAELPDQRQLRSLLWAGDSTWTDYALDFDVCSLRGVDKGAVVRGS